MSVNPFGLQTITPYLVVTDARAVIKFAQELLNATLRGDPHVDPATNRLVHAEMKIGDSVVMIGEATEKFAPTNTSLYTYVEDCDAMYQKALAMGAKAVLELTTYPHGDRYGGVKDPCGNTWWLVTHVGKLDTAQ